MCEDQVRKLGSGQISVQFTEVEFKYLKLFMKHRNVECMADETGISARSVCFHLKSIEWTLKSADCFG
jgi:hypothetical protein